MINFRFDAAAHRVASAERERALLKQVVASRDEAAACELLFYFAEFGRLNAPEVQERLENGARQVISLVLEKVTTPGADAPRIQPLMYFDIAADRKRGSKGGTKKTQSPHLPEYKASDHMTRLVEMREAMRLRLSEDDAKEALTTQWDAVESVDRSRPTRWPSPSFFPQTVGDLEKRFVSYLCEYKFKGVHPAVALHYVHSSFPENPWDRPRESVQYPPGW